MRVLVCGAAGFMGKAICARLAAAGHEVVRGVRKPVRAGGYQISMDRVGIATHERGDALPQRYWAFAKRWELLGYPAFAAMMAL
ncbi:NAD-dependent epimerase/dehydratase family protein [Aromatoleum toluolicum]|uniref:NAD-dependent epimerase/dehydratase family protein n=1 Tax=Aromatoleum toluolicum TaxID=90060 RepID=A0ABX1NB00_9RHOO|nr:NAD-dependent epimerase/dehydratase family protein [Aromatoleum toluolicum]NMF96472.1 NAD-dependent epimerase/dehydratase family protein [Aromatoleum toluolicum]